MKKLRYLSWILIIIVLMGGCSSKQQADEDDLMQNEAVEEEIEDDEEGQEEMSIVYMSEEISADSLIAVYDALDAQIEGNVAVKLSTGEP